MASSLYFSMILVFALFSTAVAAPPSNTAPSPLALKCSGHRLVNFTIYKAFSSNFQAAMHTLISQSAAQGYARAVRGSSMGNIVYAFGECVKNISRTNCSRCLGVAPTHISQCTGVHNATRAGAIYFDDCYLRYDDHDFFTGKSDAIADYHVKCWGGDFDGDQNNLRENTDELIKKLTVDARDNNGFSVASLEKGDSSVDGLVQCWRLAHLNSCRECLMHLRETASCLPKMEGRLMTPLCYMRYSIHKISFGSDSGKLRSLVIVVIVVSSSLVITTLIIMSIAFICKDKPTDKRGGIRELTPLAITMKKSNSVFKYETLERATNNFDISNKLGQGGSSAVFKGVLEDGTVVAVKKLFYGRTECVEQLFNEINLVSSIEHKNLVKLLGWCITESESLLVYEYMPNGSLQQYISDECIRQRLSWEIRFNILLGVAEGLTYLHEEHEQRVVHRDIKLGNVLLDENYNVKIADFGLSRLLPADRSHLKTNTAGTMGYMSPEYVVHGILTEKADVFSFGVVLIELITGKRVGRQPESPVSLLQMIWDLYESSELPKAVDPILKGSFPINKASRVLQIGLLCAQTSSEARPKMSMVVKMLKGRASLPVPTQPPFLKSGSLSSPLAAVLGIADPRPGPSSNQSSFSLAVTNEIEEEKPESLC